MDEDLNFRPSYANSSYSKLQGELAEAESKLHLARTQRNEAMTRIGELVKELEQCKTPESPETEAERERKALIADRLGVPSGGFLGPHVLNALDELEHLRKAHSEADNSAKNMYNANVALSKEIHSVRLELAALRERANVDPPADQVEALARVFRDEHAKVMGTDALSYGLTVFCAYARVAIAHLSKRPEGLPTADELAQIYNRIYYGSAPEKCRVNWESIPEACREDMVRGTEAILTALRPWLRDPVGWEMDVHPDQLELYKWVTEPDGGYAYAAQQALDLCRARIRPAYECKECAKKQNDIDLTVKALEMINQQVRAALEP